jgi:hypothetical protein
LGKNKKNQKLKESTKDQKLKKDQRSKIKNK